jgi:hypothetical protein
MLLGLNSSDKVIAFAGPDIDIIPLVRKIVFVPRRLLGHQ